MEILELIGVPYFKKGKGIHIKKKNRGKFTEYCGGKVTQECIDKAKKSKNPTLRKRAIFADNSRKWKHAEGGIIKAQLGTMFLTPQPLSPVEVALNQAKAATKSRSWANRFEDLSENFKKAVIELAKSLNLQPKDVAEAYNSGKIKPALAAHYKNVSARVRSNDSPTAGQSLLMELSMNNSIYRRLGYVLPNMAYAIPYIEELEITIPGVGRTTTNALDSLAKYAVEAQIPLYEAIGLGAQETALGAQPLANYKNIPKNGTDEEKQEVRDYNRALGNSSYFRNYGIIPAENLVRDFRYNIEADPISRNTPPLLHAFTYWKLGNYNRGDASHTEDVRRKGQAVMQTKAVQNWIQNSEFARRALQTNE